MNLYSTIDDTLTKLVNKDIFKLLGLDSLSTLEKEDYMDQFIALVSQYFLQEKIASLLTEEQKNGIITKYSDFKKESFDSFLEEVSEIIPEASDLFTEALLEMKARLVKEHYTSKKENLEKELSNAQDQEKKDALQIKLQQCEKNLAYAISGSFELIENNTNLIGK